MKKEYLSPKVKVQFMVADPLMDVSVSDTEVGPEFDEGAKDTDMGEDDFGSIFTNKSVWDD